MLKVGQMVKVVNEGLDSYGRIAKIVDVDAEWSYPYELEFKSGEKFTQELYGEDDIRLLLSVGADDNDKKTIEESIDDLIERVKNEAHNRENSLVITKLQEARMWYLEGKNTK